MPPPRFRPPRHKLGFAIPDPISDIPDPDLHTQNPDLDTPNPDPDPPDPKMVKITDFRDFRDFRTPTRPESDPPDLDIPGSRFWMITGYH